MCYVGVVWCFYLAGCLCAWCGSDGGSVGVSGFLLRSIMVGLIVAEAGLVRDNRG